MYFFQKLMDVSNIISLKTTTTLYFKNKAPRKITEQLLNDYPTKYRVHYFSSNGALIEEIYYNTYEYHPLVRHRKWTPTGQLVRDVEYDEGRRFHGRYQTYATDGRLKCNYVYNHGIRVVERDWLADFTDLRLVEAVGAAITINELEEMRLQMADGTYEAPLIEA